METMKRPGMTSCGLDCASWAGIPGTYINIRSNRRRLKPRSRQLLFFLHNSKPTETKVSRKVEHAALGVTWLKDSGPETSYFLAEASSATGVSTLATLRFHSSAPFRRRPPRSLQHASAVSAKQCSCARHCPSNVSLTCSANRNQQASFAGREPRTVILVRWLDTLCSSLQYAKVGVPARLWFCWGLGRRNVTTRQRCRVYM